jgi:hypothetical protein
MCTPKIRRFLKKKVLFSNSGAFFKNRHLPKPGVYKKQVLSKTGVFLKKTRLLPIQALSSKTGALPQIRRFLSEGTEGMPPLF